MSIHRHQIARSAALAAALALSTVFASAVTTPVLADSRPSILDVTLDADNHAVVKWTKEPWQGSINVKWSTGDGQVAAPNANWDGHYGYPLVDCQTDLRPDPVLGGVWNYGEHCKGQDVADKATEAVTKEVIVPGVYYFQVSVAGENHESGRPCRYDATDSSECLSGHYSGVWKITFLPGDDSSASPSSSPDPGGGDKPTPSGQPGPAEKQSITGPSHVDLNGGGQIDVGAGGQVISNPPFNFDVRFGQMHLREDLVSFHCPSWTQPFPPETTLDSWIGVRCRTVTTPQAGALVRGTEFTVTVSSQATVFQVFAGEIEVSDLAHRGAVLVGPGEMTTVFAGGVPTTPTAFDSSDPSGHWWDGPSGAWLAIVVLGVLGLSLVIYFLPLLLALARRRKQWWAVGLVDLFTAWTGVGWIVALVLALALPGPGSPNGRQTTRSWDGQWWWDGRGWQPVPQEPSGEAVAGGPDK